MDTSCAVCHTSDAAVLYNETLNIYRCNACGLLFSGQHLSAEDLTALYSEKYFFGGEYCDYLADRKILQKNFRQRLKVLRRFIDPKRHKSLLDIGCAYGFFIDMIKDQFDVIKGIDISKDATRYVRERLKLDVINDDLLKYDFGKEKFDIICMWDVIEHLQHPRLYLEKVARIMKSGALFAMTTGDIESLNARGRGNRWRLMHPPTHLHYFSKRAIARLLNDIGFDIIYNRYCGFWRSIDAVSYKILQKRLPWLYYFLRKIGLNGIGLYINLYDIMFIIARKR